MSNTFDQSRRAQGILLHTIIGSDRKEDCTWSMIGKPNDSIDGGYGLVSNMLVPYIPSPSFTGDCSVLTNARLLRK